MLVATITVCSPHSQTSEQLSSLNSIQFSVQGHGKGMGDGEVIYLNDVSTVHGTDSHLNSIKKFII